MEKKIFVAATNARMQMLWGSWFSPEEAEETKLDIELLKEYEEHDLGYTPNGGSLDLRAQIAELYGDSIGPENVLVFPGAQVALKIAAVALAADCHSIVFTPGYQSTVESPAIAGGFVTEIRRRAKDGWQIPIESLRSAIRPNTKYIILNEPYNPAGTLMSHKMQAEIISIARTHGIHIMSDEVYRFLEHNPQDRIPAICDVYEKGMSLVTMSKPWGGCGVTIGWIACSDQSVKQRLVDVQYFSTACPSRASEIQAIMTLRASDIILERNLKIIRHNLALLDEFMSNNKNFFSWVRPSAGAIAFLKFKGPLTSEQLGEKLAAAGISIKPAYCFCGGNVDESVDYFRVGFGERKMPEALAAFREFVRSNKPIWEKMQSRL